MSAPLPPAGSRRDGEAAGERLHDLSLVIACYNEEPHLEASVLEILATLEACRFSFELVFVDDGSVDRTRDVIERILRKHGERAPMRVLHHEVNTGRGRTVSDGMRIARGRVVGFLDIDLEVHARYVPAAVRAIEEGADLVIAQRVYFVSLAPTFLLRHLLSRGYRRLADGWLGLRGLDSEAGFKFFERRALLPLLEACEDPGWFWDTEVTARALRSGLKVVALPCLFQRRRDKRSTLRLLPATADYLRKLAAFRRKLATGK